MPSGARKPQPPTYHLKVLSEDGTTVQRFVLEPGTHVVGAAPTCDVVLAHPGVSRRHARLEVLPSPDGITPELIPRMRARAAELAASLGAYQTDQFRNTDMIDGYRRLGEEAAEQVPGTIDALCL